MTMIWTPKHQQAIELYFYCQSATTSASTRNYLFNNILYAPLLQLTEIVIRNQSRKYEVNKDVQQDMLIYIYEKVLPKLNKNKLQAAQQLLYVSLKNYYISYVRLATTKFDVNNTVELSNNIDKEYVEFDGEEIKKEILNAIDYKIKKEKKINKAKTVYLLLLKDYLIENDFDERNFGEYVKNKMNMSDEKYRQISHLLGISVLPFNKKI